MENEEETNHFRVIVNGAYINNNDYRCGAFSDRIKNVLHVYAPSRGPKIIIVVNKKNGAKSARFQSLRIMHPSLTKENSILQRRNNSIFYRLLKNINYSTYIRIVCRSVINESNVLGPGNERGISF